MLRIRCSAESSEITATHMPLHMRMLLYRFRSEAHGRAAHLDAHRGEGDDEPGERAVSGTAHESFEETFLDEFRVFQDIQIPAERHAAIVLVAHDCQQRVRRRLRVGVSPSPQAVAEVCPSAFRFLRRVARSTLLRCCAMPLRLPTATPTTGSMSSACASSCWRVS